MSKGNVKGRRTNYNNHVLHAGDKSIVNNAEKYDTKRAAKKTIGHNFQLVGTHSYRDVTEQELSLRVEYAKSLIVNITSANPRYVDTERIDYSYTLSRRTEVYKVSVNGKGWGKVAITTTSLGVYHTMQFVLFKRATVTSPGGIVHRDSKKPKGNWTR